MSVIGPVSRRLLIVAVVGLCSSAQAGTIYVDDDAPGDPGPNNNTVSDPLEDGSAAHPFDTIQEAIGVAVSGADDVEVADGTYDEDIDFLGKAITVYSAGGADVTTIDGGGVELHVVKCVSGEGTDTVLDGFTITGGNANGALPDYFGGGMYIINGSSPMIINCVIVDNSADGAGGGLYSDGGSPTFTNCTFDGNTAVASGGGMYNRNGSLSVTGCTFIGNTVMNNDGGGMANVDSDTSVIDCTFSSNAAGNLGGGMLNSGGSPTVTGCAFIGNTTGGNLDGGGGGMANHQGSLPTVIDCVFRGNSGDYGGAMWNGSSSPTVTNCSFSGNTAAGLGGGMYSTGTPGSFPTMTNCTFSGNTAGDGGGLYNYMDSGVTATNCILWGDSPNEIQASSPSPAITFSDIQGGYAGAGNIGTNPLFVDADGADDMAGTADDDLRLMACSQATDAGDNGAVPGGVAADLDGNPRFVDDAGIADSGSGTPPLVDMGAYERQVDTLVGIFNVPADFTTIQAAIDATCDPTEIVVAPGTYTEAINFHGKAITLRSSDGPDVTIIDGNDAFHVVQCVSGEGPYTVLDGFTITGGNAFPNNRGGGIYNVGSSPTVTNCIFSGNMADIAGAGMYNTDMSSPMVTDCVFIHNEAYIDGGGMYNKSSSNPTVTRCQFIENEANGFGVNGWGGGMFNDGTSNPTVTGCTFNGNYAWLKGGGFYNDDLFSDGITPTVANCVFSGNTVAQGPGGGMYSDGNGPVTNCMFSGNTATWGGGMYTIGSTTVTNCTFGGNVAYSSEGHAMFNTAFIPTVTNCILWDHPAGGSEIAGGAPTVVTFSNVRGGFAGTGNINADPQFIDADGADDTTGTEDDDLHLGRGSPCIDAGDSSAPGLAGVTVDIDGNGRVVSDPDTMPPAVDMGAYESAYGWATSVLDFSSQFSDPDWAATQAVGGPDTLEYGDIETAWAPSPINGSFEFITLGFDLPVYSDGLTIRETNGNGFVYQVDLLDTYGMLHNVWAGLDPSLPGAPAHFDFTYPMTTYPVGGVKVYTYTDHDLSTWEEIDAVYLRGESCAWDCDGSNDGNVNVLDVLAFLGQYDITAPINCTGPDSCDFNGDGCTDVVDLLKILAHYTTNPLGLGCVQ